MGFRQWLARKMAGRNGRDALNGFLSIISMVLIIISLFLQKAPRASNVLFYLALITLVILYFRTFSRNIPKRAAENAKFLQIRDRLLGGFSRKKHQMQDKDHVIFKCPRCKKKLRVPKGKGRISIHCPQCGTDFIETT